MADEVKVVTQDLRTKSAEIENIQFSNVMDNVPVIPPDGLSLSKTAVDNLNQNASFLYRNQDYGDREGARLAETLRSVAEAYDLADASAAASLEGNTEPQTPKTNAIPAPTMPAPMGSPLGMTADEIGDVELAQQTLSSGDHGGSLREAAVQWMANGNALKASSEQFKVKIQDWEGEAADQAYAKFVAYGAWLSQLGESWQKLAAEAMRISDAHVKALLNHTPVYQQYEQLKTQMIAAIANGGSAAHTLGLEMEKLQRASEDIIDGYSKEAAPQLVTPPNPPPTGVPTVPVTGSGQANHAGSNGHPSTAPGGGGGSGGGGGGPTPSMPQSAANASPMSAETPGGETPSGGGSGSGGGSPAGGGAPSGGSPGGDMPNLPGGEPGGMGSLPDDPSLHPAAAGAGGGAGGGSGGGAGGGTGSIPLQPNVGGVSVGPGPAGAGGAGGAPATGGAAAGMMGGGMGGGMGGAHGGQAQGGKEKRRTPGLSPDEDLYVEDREYTEEVIGARKRRTVQDPKDSK